MKKLILIILVAAFSQLHAQTVSINGKTVYLTTTVDALLAKQTAAFSAQITTLQNQLTQQQAAINTNTAVINKRVDSVVLNGSAIWVDTAGLQLIKGTGIPRVDTLRNLIFVK
jgi:hypothetical protein